MNEPETRNALTGNTAADEFVSIWDKIDSNKKIKAAIINGSRAVFSAGGSLKQSVKWLTLSFFGQIGIHRCRILDQFKIGIIQASM